MKQFLLTENNYQDFNKINPITKVKQLGIQTDASGYEFNIYLKGQDPIKPIIIGSTRIYEIDLSNTDLYITKIDVPVVNKQGYIIIDVLEEGVN